MPTELLALAFPYANFSTSESKCESENPAYAKLATAKVDGMQSDQSTVRRDNLRRLIDEKCEGSQTQLKDRTGISLSQLGQWLSGDRNMSERSARAIETSLGLTERWFDTKFDKSATANTDEIRAKLASGSGNVAVWQSKEDLPPDDTRVWVARWDYTCSAGDGGVQWEIRERDALPFTAAFFKAIASDPRHCKLLMVRGDSMEPFLFNRDMVMVDDSRTAVRDGKVYALCFEDEPLVKQAFKQPGGALTLHSYNPDYPDRTVSAEEMKDVVVIGEVVYRSGSGFADF